MLDYAHQRNVERFEAGKCDVLSQSAIEFKDIVDETYENNNLRGLKTLRKDLSEASKALPKNTFAELQEKLGQLA